MNPTTYTEESQPLAEADDWAKDACSFINFLDTLASFSQPPDLSGTARKQMADGYLKPIILLSQPDY